MAEDAVQVAKAAKAKNSRRERFHRVAERRTIKLLRDIRYLAKCSNKSAYEYTQRDVNEIFDTIQNELDRAKAGFTGEREVRFKLSSREEVNASSGESDGT